MHDIETLLSAIGGLIGALTVAYNAWGNHKKSTSKQSIDTLNAEIKLKEADAEVYRKKWLKAEQGNDELRNKIDRLQNKVNRLEKEGNKDG